MVWSMSGCFPKENHHITVTIGSMYISGYEVHTTGKFNTAHTALVRPTLPLDRRLSTCACRRHADHPVMGETGSSDSYSEHTLEY